jgi:uncharacterized membrane protein YfcA
VTPAEAALLAGAGLVAGVVNTLAGGGSLVSVPLLVLLGLPGALANGTNRVGVLFQSAVASWRFGAEGVPGLRRALPVLLPALAGSALGAFGVARLPDESFERAFGFLMLLLLVPTLRTSTAPAAARPVRPWPRWISLPLFFAIGLYGGSFQAGVGLVLVAALSHAGFGLVEANSVKVVVNTALTGVAVPVFVWAGQVSWPFAGVLAVGFAAGGALGARLAVRGGDRLIRPVLAVAVVALAGRMLGLY